MPTRVKIVSGWLVLPLSNFDYNNAHSLQARYTLASPAEYDYNTHVQLAYARRKGRDSYVYDRLPASFNTSRGNVQVGFDLNQTSFTINIWNTDFPDQRPAKEQFEKMEYRFIVIPKSTYLGLHIDWNDYAAVASALNLPVSSSFISQLP
jgi:hypothetical protein